MSAEDLLRQQVGARAGGRCEYCLIHEEEFLFPHQLDHIRARQHAGTTTLDNLALACPEYNSYKGPNLASVDPDSDEQVWLFNPRRDRWADHFALDGAIIRGLTPKGRATAFLLNFNTEDRMYLRRRLQRAGRYSVK